MSAYIEELKDAIRNIHGVETTHVSNVPVKRRFSVSEGACFRCWGYYMSKSSAMGLQRIFLN